MQPSIVDLIKLKLFHPPAVEKCCLRRHILNLGIDKKIPLYKRLGLQLFHKMGSCPVMGCNMRWVYPITLNRITSLQTTFG